MSWAQPAWFLALPLLVAVAAVVVLAARRHRVQLERWFRGAALERALPLAVQQRRVWRDAAALLALALGVVALAEPRFDKQLQQIEAKGTDLVLVVDLSRSMDATDVQPSRLVRAQREIADLLALRPGDRVGLVVFAGGAVPRLPLTLDHRAVQTVLGEIQTADFQAQGSDVGGAIRAAVRLLSRDPASAAGKAIVLLSDGEVHDPADAAAAAESAAAAKIPVFAVGIGEAAAPVPTESGPLVWEGEAVVTTPDPGTLQDLARATGGAYVTSVASADDMEGLASELERSLVAVSRVQQQRETWRSAYAVPLFGALVCALFAAWMGDGRDHRRRSAVGVAAGSLALALALAAAPVAEAGALADADALYRAGQAAQAVRALEELALAQPDDPAVLERLGAARYRAGDFEGAAQAFDRTAELRGRASDWYNAGNAHYQAGRLERARDRYDQVLSTLPEHEGATQNRERVEKELAERRKPKPPPPPQGGGSEDPSGGGGQDGPEPQPGAQDPNAPPQGGQGQPGDGPPQPGEGEAPAGGPPPPGHSGQGAGETPDVSQIGDQAPGDPSAQGGASAPSGEAGDVSAAAAERLLDSVEEGQPGYSYGGPPGGKPW
jgi:Ca-activated chloride channel family protein